MPDYSSELSEVIGRIYDCALDPAQWPDALAAIGAFIGGNRARIFLFNANPARPGDGESFGVDRDFNKAFDRDVETLASIKYGFVVAELDRAMTLPEILGTTGGRDVNGRLPYDNRFYREWMEPRGAHDALAALVVKTPQQFGGLAMTRSTPLPPFGPEDKEKIRLLAPHIRRALTISDLVGERALAADRFAQVIESLVAPVVIVDGAGAIAQANAAARKLIDERSAIAADQGVLRAVDPVAREELKAALASGRGRRISTVALAGAGSAGAIATVLRLDGADGAQGLAVFIQQPGQVAMLPGEAFAKLYGLTGAELRVALLLVEGASVDEIAARLGSAADTVRWHIKNLRAKTGSARVSDLIRLAAQATSPVRDAAQTS